MSACPNWTSIQDLPLAERKALPNTTFAPIKAFSPRREFYQELCEGIMEEEARCSYLIYQVDMAWFENIDCLPYACINDYYIVYQYVH